MWPTNAQARFLWRSESLEQAPPVRLCTMPLWQGAQHQRCAVTCSQQKQAGTAQAELWEMQRSWQVLWNDEMDD
jgi:hypothetical protein